MISNVEHDAEAHVPLNNQEISSALDETADLLEAQARTSFVSGPTGREPKRYVISIARSR